MRNLGAKERINNICVLLLFAFARLKSSKIGFDLFKAKKLSGCNRDIILPHQAFPNQKAADAVIHQVNNIGNAPMPLSLMTKAPVGALAQRLRVASRLVSKLRVAIIDPDEAWRQCVQPRHSFIVPCTEHPCSIQPRHQQARRLVYR